MSYLLLTSCPIALSELHKSSRHRNEKINNYTLYGSSSVSLKMQKKKNDQSFCWANGRGRDSLDSSIPKETELTKTTKSTAIGILEFLQGKNYFITGGTGLLGKAIVEKILRASWTGVGKIYILIKADTKEAALERLKADIIDSDILECLRRMLGKSYEAFMLSKVVPIAGNVGESNLGMDPNLMHEIAQEVDVIINSAANTTFDERYDVAFNVNTRGPCRVLDFARRCKRLCAFIHVSTAFVNGERKEDVIQKNSTPSLPIIDVEMKMAFDLSLDLKESERTRYMKEMGLERARRNGWRNVYEFTKAMGEMVMNNKKEEIPIVIVRPSIIESTYKEPFGGWIQGNRMADPFLLSYGQGRLPVFINPQAIVDIIPADMVVNTIIAAMAKHGGIVREEVPDLPVYNVVSSGVNPLTCYDVFDFCYQHFTSCPMTDKTGKKIHIKRMKFIKSKDEFSSSMLDALTDAGASESRRQKWKYKRIVEHIANLVEIYDPYIHFTSRFESENTEKLLGAMSEEEKLQFGFDVKSIDWKNFFMNIHLPGLRKHLKNNKGIVAN